MVLVSSIALLDTMQILQVIVLVSALHRLMDKIQLQLVRQHVLLDMLMVLSAKQFVLMESMDKIKYVLEAVVVEEKHLIYQICVWVLVMLELLKKILFVRLLVHLEIMLIPVHTCVLLLVQIQDMLILPQILVFKLAHKIHSEILLLCVRLPVLHCELIILQEHAHPNAQMVFGAMTISVLKFALITLSAMKLTEIVMISLIDQPQIYLLIMSHKLG